MSEITTPEEFDQLKLECLNRVRFYVDLANKKLDLRMPYPVVTFDLRGTTAGRAWCGRNRIQFQPTLLFENAEDFILQTAGHEVGHLAAHEKYRGREIAPHGAEWQSVMNWMGLPSTRCHNYETGNVSTRLKSRISTTNKLVRTLGGTARYDGIATVIDLD